MDYKHLLDFLAEEVIIQIYLPFNIAPEHIYLLDSLTDIIKLQGMDFQVMEDSEDQGLEDQEVRAVRAQEGMEVQAEDLEHPEARVRAQVVEQEVGVQEGMEVPVVIHQPRPE